MFQDEIDEMLLTELQTYSLTHMANMPFSSASSGDNSFSFITEKGVDILQAGIGRTGLWWWLTCLLLVTSLGAVSADDATNQMFGGRTDGMPAAFGDFNSDELTDIFVIRNNARTLEILFGQDKEPSMVSSGIKCTFNKTTITSVVPGDFNGDALMDVLVTLFDPSQTEFNQVVILWGEMNKIVCSEEPLFRMRGQPLAIDYDKNMIIDLFGVDEHYNRSFWVFSQNKTMPKKFSMNNNDEEFKGSIRIPHSHAFLDLSGDDLADLYITTEESFEVWKGNEDISKGFKPWKIIPLPPGFSKNKQHVIGQTIFLDVEMEGKLDHLVPVCFDLSCKNSSILVYKYSNKTWHNLQVNFHEEGTANLWKFAYNSDTTNFNERYTETITLRAGDFNMDGYPDLLVTLVNDARGTEFKSFLLENVPCKTTCSEFSRTFEVRWNTLSPYNNNTVLGVFYDFLQDGVLDIIFVHNKPTYNVSAYRNTNNYDANFVKVMVVTGLTNTDHPLAVGPLTKSAGVYGTNLPGPKVFYVTTTQEGDPRSAVATQIPQSAHFTLNLPYTIFGLGRTPNFIDSLTVQVYGKYRQWTQLIPNSQMVVIPWPVDESNNWKVQLFVTPSKLIFQSVLALLATCVVIFFIIAALYWKERKEDHLEKLQEAHKFHFDAM
uniref:T-cell immunomodulatory protein TIP C2 domain-containing protein n=1 Tax=Homalodisca liturata TaxID=320908 RepID=A0A1B6IZN2_9HEMI